MNNFIWLPRLIRVLKFSIESHCCSRWACAPLFHFMGSFLAVNFSDCSSQTLVCILHPSISIVLRSNIGLHEFFTAPQVLRLSKHSATVTLPLLNDSLVKWIFSNIECGAVSCWGQPAGFLTWEGYSNIYRVQGQQPRVYLLEQHHWPETV